VLNVIATRYGATSGTLRSRMPSGTRPNRRALLKKHVDVVAVEPDATTHSAGDLLARVNQLTRGLRDRGLRPGDGMAILAPNGIAAPARW